jgi:hypothetical protein
MGALNRPLPAGAVILALADEWLILVASCLQQMEQNRRSQ